MKPYKNNGNSKLLDQIAWGINHDAFDDELGHSLLRVWCAGAADGAVAEMIHNRVHTMQMQELFGRLPPFRIPRLHEGEVVLGRDLRRQLVRICHQWFGSGMLVVSNTGGGKSNLLALLAVQIAGGGCRVWIVEMYKSQMRHLRRLFHLLGQDLLVLRAADWKFNLLQAGTCNPRLHLVMAVDLLVRVLGLPPRARSILNQVCHDLYREFGIWDGRKAAYPCLFDAYERVRQRSDLNAPAREAILDRLGSLLIALTPKCAAFRLAWNAVDLARYSIVFEMRGASETVKQILLEPALYSLFLHEVERGVFNQPMDLFVALEDAQRLFDASAAIGAGEITPLDELAGIIRGSAKSMGVIAQTAHGLSRRLVPNLAMKFFGRLGSHEDFSVLGADLGLNSQQIEWARLHLKPGMFVGQVAEGDWREPFVFSVPLLNIPAVVDDREAAASLKPLDALPTTPAVEFADWHPHHVIDLTSSKVAPTAPLSEVELRFLKEVVANPGKASTCYAKMAHVNGRRAAEIRARLVAASYLREHSVATGPRGRAAIVLEPLDPAHAVVSTFLGGARS